MNSLQHVLVPIVFFMGIVIIVIAILNFILRLRIINSGQKDAEYIKLLGHAFDYQSSALKWGLLLLYGGIGLIVIHFIPDDRDFESSLLLGIEAVFLAAGFLTYYFIVRKSAE